MKQTKHRFDVSARTSINYLTVTTETIECFICKVETRSMYAVHGMCGWILTNYDEDEWVCGDCNQ